MDNAGKAPEVVVPRDDGAGILGGKGGAVRIRDQIPRSPSGLEQAAEDGPVMLPWAQGRDKGLSEQRIHEGYRLFRSHRISNDTSARREPDERQNHDPRQTDSRIA